MKIGEKYIGVGVGAIILNENNEIFLAQRGKNARNEQGFWEFPGGCVEFGETMENAIIREIDEEYGFSIEITAQLGAFNHLLDNEKEHWISITFICKYISGTPEIKEQDKCSKIGWFEIDDLPKPLTIISDDNLKEYLLMNKKNTDN